MKVLYLALMALFLNCNLLWAQDSSQPKSETGLPIPRFVSLRSELVNARSGPGARYPIEWVYMQKGAPVEIVAEFELWRKIKDWQGSQSWVHKAMLTGKRTVKVITPGENNLYAKPNFKSRVLAKVEDEVVGDIMECPGDKAFCRVRFSSVDGWIPKQNLYGIYPQEVIE